MHDVDGVPGHVWDGAKRGLPVTELDASASTECAPTRIENCAELHDFPPLRQNQALPGASCSRICSRLALVRRSFRRRNPSMSFISSGERTCSKGLGFFVFLLGCGERSSIATPRMSARSAKRSEGIAALPCSYRWRTWYGTSSLSATTVCVSFEAIRSFRILSPASASCCARCSFTIAKVCPHGLSN